MNEHCPQNPKGIAVIDTIEGGCRCGRIRYQAKLSWLPQVYACHCRDCQTWSGSAFSLQFILPRDRLEVSGKPKLFDLASSDGKRVSSQHACEECFTRVFNTNTALPGMAVVRAGTLDHSDQLNIVAHIWTQRKLSGIAIPDDVAAWPQSASSAELGKVLAMAEPSSSTG